MNPHRVQGHLQDAAPRRWSVLPLQAPILEGQGNGLRRLGQIQLDRDWPDRRNLVDRATGRDIGQTLRAVD